ncbi:DegT/DnrJ/EryC1/StrS family aminotransferase [Paraburkholderia bannensis]|uniref:DegT/DnrJ/EryC1/StrS family aminotransferase n=1 Tax=Paraburkholderia bannensis TaxID=765414 RepID=UPI002AB7C506|nr:DegT/DnrJ/EryC1/StrS family aminotransferase [Paraburkholderia bannensis]
MKTVDSIADTANIIALGQRNLPSRDQYDTAMRDIFARRYYTNQGPLAREFEARLQRFLDARHVICVTNPTIGLMMAFDAAGIRGSALVPATGHPGLRHALNWCGIEAMACDVDIATAHLRVDHASSLLGTHKATALIGSGLSDDAAALSRLGESHGIPVLFESLQAFAAREPGSGSRVAGQIEVFAFGLDDIVYAGGGACVATDDDVLAARLRNIRSSYGAGAPVPVEKTSNGRMSEAQAVLGLLGLDRYAERRAHNSVLFETYRERLNAVDGVRVIEPGRATASNYQSLVCEIVAQEYGFSRDELIVKLAANGVESRPAFADLTAGNDAGAFAGAAWINASWLALPLGAHLDVADVGRICDLIASISAMRDSKGGVSA